MVRPPSRLRRRPLGGQAAEERAGRFELFAGAQQEDAVGGQQLLVGAGVDDALAAALDADDAGAGAAAEVQLADKPAGGVNARAVAP